MTSSNPLVPLDHEGRRQFILEWDRNFSVIASAGAGKTAAMVERVVHLALGPQGTQILPTLVVVTYTQRAAAEMQQRVRSEILKRNPKPSVLGALQRVFFGTIHSFCLQLISKYGHFLGIPPQLDLVENDEALWLSFLREQTEVGRSLPEEDRKRLFRHLRLRSVMERGRRLVETRPFVERKPMPFPVLDFEPLLRFPPNHRSKGRVERGQAILRKWIEKERGGADFLPLPKYVHGGKGFQVLWERTFRPLRAWLNAQAFKVAEEVAAGYRAYRFRRRQMTFDDQVVLAAKLLQHSEVGLLLRKKGFRVILDEAQDTDPRQFEVLLELTRPEGVVHGWLEAKGAENLDSVQSGSEGPRQGHFCMVGDPQQSIYGDRAHLSVYMKVHQMLVAAGAKDPQFHVTFRCDRSIVDVVNRIGPALLHGKEGQLSYVPLWERPAIRQGQVIRIPWMSTAEVVLEKMSEGQRARLEAQEVVGWIRSQGLEKLRASSWSEVALLCPRKAWLSTLGAALQEAGLARQIHSTEDLRVDHPAYAWLGALAIVLSEPQNHFEIVGVLREIFGISDQELAHFARGNGTLFQIELPPSREGVVSEALGMLYRVRQKIQGLPLFDQVRTMVREVQLRERLGALPREEFPDLDEELDRWILSASEAEIRGESLSDWSRSLQRGAECLVPSRPVQRDSLQLITCQKAKGLQWDAVIVPFFHRKIRRSSTSLSEEAVGLHKWNHGPLEEGEEEDPETGLLRRHEQELQRLLYVTLTRAKRTLVVVDDAALFPSSKISQTKSFAELLDPTIEENLLESIVWAREPTLDSTSPVDQVSAAVPSSDRVIPFTREDLHDALAKATHFARRTLPHTLAIREDEGKEELVDLRLSEGKESRAAGEAVDYGIWWHQMMECLPWEKAIESWEEVFRRDLPQCPDPDRAQREWNLFIRSDRISQLQASNIRIRTEVPFLWTRNPHEVVEGVMDLFAVETEKERCFVVDWKTDRGTAAEMDPWLHRYTPQIQTYVAAVENLTGWPCRGWLYSTSTGLWLTVPS